MVSSEPLTKSTALSPVQHLGAEPSTNLFARPVPQDFHFAELRWAGRLLTRSDGAVSWFYRVLQISTMLVTIWMADFVLKYSKISLTWSQLAQKGPLTIINTAPSPVLGYSAVLWAATILATLVPLDAARVALDPLSSGLLQCELQANCAHVDSSKAKTLRNWRIGLGLASVIMAPASFVSCIVTMLGDLSNWGFYPVAGIWLATVVSLSCAVWLSMQVAIVLTSDAIGKVIDLIQSTPVVAGEGWVHLSTQVLALNDKLRTLNKGWGELIAGIGLCSSLAGVAYFCSAVGCADPVEVIKCPQTTGSLLLQGMISLVVPVVASTSFVEISKRCREVTKVLNLLRHQSIGDQQAVLILRELETAIAELNNGKGLGFIVYGFVVDAKLLKQTAQKLMLVSGPAATYIMSFLPNDAPTMCKLSEMQIETIKAVMSNTSACTWGNMTIASVLAAGNT